MNPSPTRPTDRALCAVARGFLFLLTLGAFTVTAANPGPQPTAADPHLASMGLPFAFEANRGQAAEHFQFLAHGRGCAFLLAPDEVAVVLAKPGSGEARRTWRGDQEPGATPVSAVRWVRMALAGANPIRKGVGADPFSGRVNYLLGNNPGNWHTDVPTFAKVRFTEVYPGVDVIYYGRDRQLEFDFVVAPGADASAITIEISGTDKVSVDANGELVMQVGGEQLRQHAPLAYQTVQGRRVTVASRFRLTASNRVVFELGAYDRSQTLVIDPVFSYATYFGGPGKDVAWNMAVDASGAVFFAGETTSAQLPTIAGAFQTNYGGGVTMEGRVIGGDAFVAKLGPAGTNLVYLTYLGGTAMDGALGLAIDPAGNAYVTGFTASTNFPTAGPLQTNITGFGDKAYNIPPIDAFVAKLSPDGRSLVYSGYLGGTNSDEGIAIAVNQTTGEASVAGFTDSRLFPVVNALQREHGGRREGFIAKLNAAGSAFEYVTYIGGNHDDYCNGIAVDAVGFTYVTGVTQSTNFWNVNAVQPQINNPSRVITTNLSFFKDAFVTKLTPAGAIVYSTYLGGEDDELGFNIAADALGYAYVVGSARSVSFPVTYDLDGGIRTNRGRADVFVTKVAPGGGTNWVYSVMFGGLLQDEGWDLAVDAAGEVAVIGTTSSANFPTLNVPPGGSATNNGLSDAFIAGLTADGRALTYSFYYGGRLGDLGAAIRRDPAGNLIVVGSTSSTNLYVQNARQPVFAGGEEDAFIARLVMPPMLSIAAQAGALQVAWPAPTPEYTLESQGNLGGTNWSPVNQPPTVVNGQHTVSVDGSTNASGYFRLRLK